MSFICRVVVKGVLVAGVVGVVGHGLKWLANATDTELVTTAIFLSLTGFATLVYSSLHKENK